MPKKVITCKKQALAAKNSSMRTKTKQKLEFLVFRVKNAKKVKFRAVSG